MTTVVSLFCFSSTSWAACGANTRTWQPNAGTNAWNTNNNWNPANRPNAATENALIISDWYNPLYPGSNFSLGCLEIQSGLMTLSAGGQLTIAGDYFRNLNLGSINVPGGSTWELYMSATANQTVDNVDDIPRLRINNSTSVRLTEAFAVTDRFLIDNGTGEVIIEGDFTTNQTSAITIPASTIVTLDADVTWTLAGNLVVDGTLVMGPGSKIKLANGRSLTINATGSLDINGNTGKAATINAVNASSTYTFTVNGTIDAKYLVIDHMSSTGLNLNGTATRFDNVDIKSIPSNGRGITLGASASIPATLKGIGFFSNGTGGPFTNIHAVAFNVSNISLTNWSGLGDTAYENDPNNRISWGTEASPKLQIQNLSPSGTPPTTIAKGSAYTHFATFAFSMSGVAAAATEVTSITFTVDGTNYNSDVAGIRVYNDTNGNCVYNAGTDTLIGSTLSPSGVPGTVTVSLSSGEISVIDTNQDCIHVLMATNTTATTNNTIGIKINATDDIINSQDYDLSDISAPPVSAGVSTISGTSVARWNGGYGDSMTTAANWTPSGVPGTGTDCEIGAGYSNPRMTGAFSCLNTRFQSTGTLNWNNTTNIFNIYGAWIVENGFTFQTSNNAVVNIRGTVDQTVHLGGNTFPNDVNINNTGSGTITFEDSGTISGNLTINSGNVTIANGANLTVLGNITVTTGDTLTIEPGGTLTLGNNSTLTVNNGGILHIVGSPALTSMIRSINNASAYVVNVSNGATIRAQYYTMRNLGTTGLTINATANIDATYHLQNGTFQYPRYNNGDMLRLFREIPGDNLDGMTFDADGSTATGVMSIYTSVGASSDTLTIDNFSGNRTGATYTDDNTYLVSWGSAVNEIKITSQSTAPASSNQGAIVDMGTFGFQQLNAGAFNNTDLSAIRVTLTGTGSSSDVDYVSLYYDSACSGAGGTLIGSKAFSGNPPRAEFTGITGATVQAHATTPPLRCINVEFGINSLATNGKTVGAEISSTAHVTNSENYLFNSSFAPPLNLGTTSIVGSTTQWTGNSSTAWTTAGNWTSGVPNANINCIINDRTRDPIISSAVTCKSVNIGNGILTISGGSLSVYGSLESTGTITATAPIIMRDNGTTPTSQNIDITSTLNQLQFNKTAGGSVNINNDLTVTSAISLAGSQNFTLNVTNGNFLRANAGMTVSGATVNLQSGSELQIASGQTLLINGGTFRTSGTNDAFPQSLTNKAHITNTGGTGRWTFSATSGTVDLTGFYIDWLNTSGLNISGTANLTNLNGGQLRNLPTTASMRALQFNSSGTLPTTSTNFGWNWGPNGSPPTEATSYFLGFSSGCGNKTITFDQWFGDFWPYTTATTTSKVSATNCNIIIDKANSPVSLTHLAAIPYNNKVLVEWKTGNEWDHRGFNVYRSLNPNDGYVQVNTALIKNDLFSTSIHGTYAFIDEGAQNGVTYYYMLEDLSLMGESTLHGPISATPDVSLGDPGLISAGTIISSNDDDTIGDDNGSNGDVLEAARNVWVLSQTENYMRLKIVIPGLTTSVDPEDNNYTKLAIQDYSPSTEEGAPELLNRTILIKIPNASATADFEIIDHQRQLLSSLMIAPAPKYIADGDQFVPQWFKDESAYSHSTFLPEMPLTILNPVDINGQNYLPILVQPISFNPNLEQIYKSDEITLDIYLNGQPPWTEPNLSANPWAREGSLKIAIQREGLFSLSYDEMVLAGVIAPFDGIDIADLHLVIGSKEISMDVISADNTFNSGDEIRFYAPHFKTDEDIYSYALLYRDSQSSGLFASSVDGTPIQEISSNSSFWTQKNYEENNIAIFNEPYTDSTDHFVWSLIYGVSGGARSPLETEVNLPAIDYDQEVLITVLVKGRMTQTVNTNHHIELYINDHTEAAADHSFDTTETHSIQFRVPGYHFADGKNKIRLEATGNNLIAGEYDMIYVDKIDVYYYQSWLVSNNQALVVGQYSGESFELDGFNNNDILAYDVSQPGSLDFLANIDIQASSLGFKAHVGLNGSSPNKRLWLGTKDSLLQSPKLKLTHGSDLKNIHNEADVLYIGHIDMLGAIQELEYLRSQQGFKTFKASLEDIYNEFGKGSANVESIKEFISFTRTYWAKAPRYIVLLGDGTYDPKAYQNPILKYRFPIKFMMGSSFDYASDNWFVSNENNHLPKEVIARIPAKNPEALMNYAKKVVAYESGAARPQSLSPFTFFSDKAHFTGENFEKPIRDIASLNSSSTIANKINHVKRTENSNAQLKQSILDSFSNSSLIHYMGHGAENMWADADVFENSDILTLENSRYPVVVAMNCLNAHFYDPELDSLGELSVMKKDGGAIAFWGSTSMTPPSLQNLYQNSFYENLMNEKVLRLGDLVKMTKTQAGLSSPHDEILNSWVIIGDPLVSISAKFNTTKTSTPTPVADNSSGGSSGCSAFANSEPFKTKTPWDLVLGFLIECLIMLAFLRFVGLRVRTQK